MFILLYILMIVKPKYRPFYALAVAAVYLIAGILPVSSLLSAINWNVLMMIGGTMIIVHYFIASKMPNLLADVILEHSKNVMWVTIYMSLFSGIISAFIDNIPYVATMLPVVASLSAQFMASSDASVSANCSTLLYFGLLVGATLGGNLTPVGASANITGIGILRREGCSVSAGTFMKFSVPFTLSAVLVGYVLLWIIWA